MRAAPLALALAALTLSGCETTAEKSAHLERQAKLAAAHQHAAQSAITVTRDSAVVTVVGSTLLRGSEGAAAVVTLRNHSARAQRALPISITVRNASGRVVFSNSVAGAEAALVSVPSIAAHGSATWVDDQVPAGGAPASVSARVGEGTVVHGALPAVAATGVHATEDPANGPGAAGTVSNRSSVLQHDLVVYVLARSGARVVAAGRSVLPELQPGASLPFQAFLIGSARGASLQTLAAPADAG